MPLNCVAGEDFKNPLDCKEIKPVNPKGNQPWIFTGRTDAEAEAPILWPLYVKSSHIGKTLMLEKTLESSLDSKVIKPVNPKGNQFEYSLEGLMLKLKLQYFGHLWVKSLSRVQLFATPWTVARQASLSITKSEACSISCALSRWCHPTISSSVIPFSSCLQSFPASGSFLMNQLFTSGGQSIGASALASVLPMNIQGWFPLGLTGLISLHS